MTSPKATMGLSSPLKDCNYVTKRCKAIQQNAFKKFPDSHSNSWDYSSTPPQKVGSDAPKQLGKPEKFEGPMEIDMETDEGEDQWKRLTPPVSAAQLSLSSTIPSKKRPANMFPSTHLTSSPDLIPSFASYPAQSQEPIKQLGSDNQVGAIISATFSSPPSLTQDRTLTKVPTISKASSMTSLQQPFNGSPRNTSEYITDDTMLPISSTFRRTGSSQSLTALPSRTSHCVQKSAFRSPGFISPSGRRLSGSRIMSGTMQAISDMIISKSGVPAKRSTSSTDLVSPATSRSLSGDQPPPLGKPKDGSVANIRAMPEVRSLPTVPTRSPPTVKEDKDTKYSVANLASSSASNNISPAAGQIGGTPTQVSIKSSTNHQSPKNTPSTRKSAALTKNNIMTSQVDSVMLVSLAGSGAAASQASMSCLTGAKEYIMDKYFEEIAKSWEYPDGHSTVDPADGMAGGSEFANTAHEGATLRPMLCSCGVERSEHGAQAEDSVSLQDHRAPCTHAKSDIRNSYSASNLRMYTRLDDLIHLEEPLTEEAVIKTLQARFYSGHYYTHIGPLLVLVNPLTFHPAPSPIGSTVATPGDGHLQRMLREASRQHMETGLSQTLLLNGASGSGKTCASMELLRRLFDVAGGGSETDAFKHLQAALTVLRALGSAATCQNPHSSRMGYMIENNISDGAIYRTKIHCYFMDQTRVVKPLGNEKNFHIFYQMLAGLTLEERAKYHLTGHSSHTLNFLSSGDVTGDDTRDREHFNAWKSALSVLGIPFADIMRALSATLLLGNLEFVEGPGLELEVEGDAELQAVASLLGVTTASLYRGLSTRTRRARGQIFKALSDPQTANEARGALAKALYCRLVAAIIKRANNTKRLVVNCANSTDSGDSGHNEGSHQDVLLSRSSTSQGSSHGVPTAHMESFIGVLDMFGFEKLHTNRFEQLCMNLCSETLQHFYNTHMFRTAHEACTEEEITADIDITYADNAPTIELLSSPRVGLLSLLDAECGLQRGCPETLLQKVHIQHSRNKLYFEPTNQAVNAFGIRHFCGDITYDAGGLLTANRNQLSDDVIATFTKQNCSFGFATHLFSQEIRAIQEDGGGPKGAVYRISPSPVSERTGDLKGSLSSDFHTKLDGILQLLVSSRPHFIRCVKSNSNHQRELFERDVVKQQLRALQVLETLHLMAAGFPHHLRYRSFNSRYRVIITSKGSNTEKQYEASQLILDKLLETLDNSGVPSANAQWALGKKHIFLSEGCRQLLEELRNQKRNQAAIVVQARWRRRMCQKKWPTLKRQLLLRKRDRQPIRKHIRRNSLLEGVALKQLKVDQQQGTNLYQEKVQVCVYGTAPQYIKNGPSQNQDNIETKRNHYGSHGSLYGPTQQYQQHPPAANHGQANNHIYASYPLNQSGKQAPSDTIHSQHFLGDQDQMVHSTWRSGSHESVNAAKPNQAMQHNNGPGRHSFHGDTRASRPTAADACSQRPRSRSTERHYISHADYQRHQQLQMQNKSRQRSYSSHTEFRDQQDQQRHLGTNSSQTSRLSQSSRASSGSGSIGPQENNNNSVEQQIICAQNQNSVYGSHSRLAPGPAPTTQRNSYNGSDCGSLNRNGSLPHKQHNQQSWHHQNQHQPKQDQPQDQKRQNKQQHNYQQNHQQQSHQQQYNQPYNHQQQTYQQENQHHNHHQQNHQQSHQQQQNNQRQQQNHQHQQQNHQQQNHQQQNHQQQNHQQQNQQQQNHQKQNYEQQKHQHQNHHQNTQHQQQHQNHHQQSHHQTHNVKEEQLDHRQPATNITNGTTTTYPKDKVAAVNGHSNSHYPLPPGNTNNQAQAPSSSSMSRGSGDLHVTFSSPVDSHPPPVPASRTYTVRGNMKLGYPQIRIMRQIYQESGTSPKLVKGQEIKVVGSADKRGFLLVELGAEVIQVPFHLTDLKTMPLPRQGIDV